jgi:hypothetical protein
MSYAVIDLDFEAMRKAYRDFKSLPPDIGKWLDDQHKIEAVENEKREIENIEREKQGKKPLPMLHSTSCCMQASLSFNATTQPIPKAGPVGRDNTTLSGGRNYILDVGEFRAYLTYKYGPTDQVSDFSEIAGMRGVLIFGGGHIEFWDGDAIFQSVEGAKRRNGNAGAVIGAGFLKSRPLWFWRIGREIIAPSGPDWLFGWWEVYDGNTYYYYFFPDGSVNYIETRPSPKWTPPKTVGNKGRYVMRELGPFVTWAPKPGVKPTEETFIRGEEGTSDKFMTATSNNYGPLRANKM